MLCRMTRVDMFALLAVAVLQCLKAMGLSSVDVCNDRKSATQIGHCAQLYQETTVCIFGNGCPGIAQICAQVQCHPCSMVASVSLPTLLRYTHAGHLTPVLEVSRHTLL